MLNHELTLEFRKKEFKKGIDPDESRRGREDEQIQIRKQKRSEALSKRRNTHRLVKEKPDKIGDEILYQNIQNLYSNDPEVVLEALKFIRKKMSFHTPPIQELIDSGIIPRIVNYLSFVNYDRIQIEAAWILANVLSGSSVQAQPVLNNTPVINYITECFKIPNKELKEQCIWCIANIAGETYFYRDTLVSNGCYGTVLNSFIYELNCEKRNIETIKTYTWALSNFVRLKPVNPEVCLKACLVLNQVIKTVCGEEVMNDALWSLSYITNTLKDEDLITFLKFNIIDQEIFKHFESYKLALPLLRTCGNLIAGPNEATQYLLDLGLLSYLPELLKMSGFRKEICWILSNIAAGTTIQIQALMKSGLLPTIIEYLKNETMSVKKECAFLIGNIFMGSDVTVINTMLNQNVMEDFCYLLTVNDVKLVKFILQSLEWLLRLDVKYHDIIEEHALDTIEMLQYGSVEEIYEMCKNIIEAHFSDTEPMEIDVTPDMVFSF